MLDRAEILQGLIEGVCKPETGRSTGFTVRESFRQEPRDGKFAPLPEQYRDPRITQAITALGISPEAIYTSQAEALEWASIGVSPFLTTETASGKSLVFQIAALKKMLEDPNARILVFYPTRALNSDQLISWQQMMKAADIPAHKVGLLDGGVSHDARLDVVRDARILICTPDIVHTWMMSEQNLATPEVQDFVKNIRMRVIDEAHLYEGVLGTKFSYLMRRLTVAQRLLNPQLKTAQEYWENYGQVVAASATITGAEDFLHELTGLPKSNQIMVITPDQDGSPRKARQVMRVNVASRKTNDFIEKYLTAVRGYDETAKSIVFVDSRKKAEQIAKRLNDEMGGGFAACYKSGYTREVRQDIENDFRRPDSNLRVLVATSAAEVGINMLPVQNVINVGIPEEAASMLQRAGRIRQGGLAVFIERQGEDVGVRRTAIADAFSRPPKNPKLYRTNEGIQGQMLACLSSEVETLTAREICLGDIDLSTWPKGFKDTARLLTEGKADLQTILRQPIPASTVPQRYFSLRDADHGRARVITYNPASSKYATIEELSHLQALNEAYPGAAMLHRGNVFRITRWNTEKMHKRGEIIIHARPADGETLTSAFTRSSLLTNLYYDPHRSGVQGEKMRVGRLNRGDFVASVGFSVRNSVSGFAEFGQGAIRADTKLGAVFYGAAPDEDNKSPFKDLEAPPAYRSWCRGLLMRVQESWFHYDARKILGQAIINEYVKRNKLSTRDFTLRTEHVEAKYSAHYGYAPDSGNMLAICENERSNFGLAQKLYDELPKILIDLAGGSDNEEVKRLAMLAYQWMLDLHEAPTLTQDQAARIHLKPSTTKATQCFLPGSIVRKTPLQGAAKSELVTIKEVEIVAGTLVYKYIPRSGTADIGAKVKRGSVMGEDFNHALPARCFTPEEGYWYTYGTIDLQNGQIDTAEHEDTSGLLIVGNRKNSQENLRTWTAA